MKRIGRILSVFLLIMMLPGCSGNEKIQAINSDGNSSTIQTNDFWIDEQIFQVNDVRIVYPIIMSKEVNDFLNIINSEIRTFLFLGENESFLTTYPGVIIMDNSYEVTYFDGKILSMCLYVDSTIGFGSGRIDRMGLTIDLSNRNKLRLSDFGIEYDYLCQRVYTGDYALSDDLIAKPLAEEILALLNSFDIYDTSTYYLGPETIHLIVENQALSRADVGVIEVYCDNSEWNVLNEGKVIVQTIKKELQ